jgi:ABC-type transport system substrate-binding protein
MKFSLLFIMTLMSLQNFAGIKPVGNPNAPFGGEFKINIGEAPTTLNPLSSTDGYAQDVQAYVMDSLLDQNPDTREWEPSLAKEWTISKDGKVFEFTLREGLKWHDGKPVTAEDVKFSFDAIMDPTNKYKTAEKKSYFENIQAAEVTGPLKIKFTVSKPYFNNFTSIAGGLTIIPAHVYKDPSKEQEKLLNKILVGSGPYILESFDRAKNIILKKNPNWWGNSVPELKGKYNFEKIMMRFIKDSTISLTSLEKGDLDFIDGGSGFDPEVYTKKTSGPKWGKEVLKQKIQNKQPKGYGFVGFNLKHPIFSSKKTRQAMVHLFNRQGMIKKFLFDMSLPATGPLYQQSDYADPNVKALEFNPKKALALLKEDGWKVDGADKFLSKVINGKKIVFSFTILEPSPEFVKYLTIFKEDAKQAGVDVNIKTIDWNAFVKLLDERNFDAVRLAWGAGDVDWDPKQIFHSESIANAGSNFVSYENKEVDKLIDESRLTMDKKERMTKLRKVFKMIADDAPYIFLFNGKFILYAHSAKLKSAKPYYQYSVGKNYWWLTK